MINDIVLLDVQGFFVDHVQETSVKYSERQGAEMFKFFALFPLVLSLQN